MEDLSLHILDIVQNSIRAGADSIGIRIVEDIKQNLLTIEIRDNGKGMDEETRRKIVDPFYTTKAEKRVGLGIPLLAQAAKESMGDLVVSAEEGKGTTITACFMYDHLDRKPLGDMGKTMIVLIASSPDIDFVFEHKKNKRAYMLNTSDMKKELDGIPINSPEVIRIIKDDISAWLNSTDNMIQ